LRSARNNLRVAENVTLILPLHRELDALRESSNALTAIGTTRRGIGPAYEDKVGRRAIRLMDLADLSHAAAQDRPPAGASQCACAAASTSRDRRRRHPERADRLCAETASYAETVWRLLDIKRREGKRILFEGAQGALLTSITALTLTSPRPTTVAAQAATGTGMGPGAVGYVLGICKAYTTRVGEGPFPTELDNEIGRKIGERGANSAPIPAARGAAAGSTRCWCARPCGPAASTGWR